MERFAFCIICNVILRLKTLERNSDSLPFIRDSVVAFRQIFFMSSPIPLIHNDLNEMLQICNDTPNFALKSFL